jgi:3-oxoacyl-[acyl-carrier-protein] synthase-1/3-oxoacyl-[acyl-carrier-protein] synthase II
VSACIVATGALSALGAGEAAYALPAPGERARVAITRDATLAAAGLARPVAARVSGHALDEERAAELLAGARVQLEASLDQRVPGWRSLRVGLCVGTSSGGMMAAERFFAAPSARLARAATYFGPFDAALGTLAPGRVVKRCQILAACASSTLALGLALRWLDRGACDVAIAGGYDALAVFVGAGFEALRATTATEPRPFRRGRDGMALGEGAALVALAPSRKLAELGIDPAAVLAHVAGFGAAGDAVHITAPDRTGGGLARAARAALADAGCPPSDVDLVSAHATATPYNDAAEARAIREVLGPAEPVVHAFKAEIGHTLGAAGVLETLAASRALGLGIAPPTAGGGEMDPDAPACLLERAEPRRLRAALKLSAAFGGLSAALVMTRDEPRERSLRAPRPVRVVAHVHVEEVDEAWLAGATGLGPDKLARVEDLGRLELAAVARLAERLGRGALAGAGVVAGSALATLDVNARYWARIVERGAQRADPRLFPATSPNAGAGHASILFDLRGPGLAVGSGLGAALEALATGAELVAAGDADRMVVVAADDVGSVARRWLSLCAPDRELRRGAVALLLSAAPPGRLVDLDLPIDPASGPAGHLALRAWLEGA